MAGEILIGSLAEQASGYDLTLPYPASWEVGKQLYALVYCATTVAPSSVPTGWGTPVAEKATSSGILLQLYGRVSASGNDDTPTWSWSGAFVRRGGIIIQVVSKCNPADPIDVISNTQYVTSNTTLRAAGVTVSASNSFGVLIGGQSNPEAETFTPPSGWDEIYDGGGTAGDFWITMSTKILPSGSTGDLDTVSTQVGTLKHIFMLVFNPAPNTRRRLFNRAPI